MPLFATAGCGCTVPLLTIITGTAIPAGIVVDQRKKKYADVLDGLERTTLIDGVASFVSPNQVKVKGMRIKGVSPRVYN